MFIEPTKRKIELKDGDSLVNPVVNFDLCKYFSMTSYKHKTHDKNLCFNSMILPSIIFEGCKISWVFNTQSEQKEEYNKLLKMLT